MRRHSLVSVLCASIIATLATVGCSSSSDDDTGEKLGRVSQAQNDPGRCENNLNLRACEPCDCDAECGLGGNGQCVGADLARGIRGFCQDTHRCNDLSACVTRQTQCAVSCDCDSECSPGFSCVAGQCANPDPSIACTCGDGRLDPGEGCDDGNNTNGDGCSKSCKVEPRGPVCGDGVLDPGEECDDPGSPTCSTSCKCECGDVTRDIDPSHYACDFNAAAGQTCLTFRADNLTIDCGGHAIRAALPGGSRGVFAAGRANITVRNCSINGFAQGIWSSDARDGGTFRDNKISLPDVSYYTNAIWVEGARPPAAGAPVNATLIQNNTIASAGAAYPRGVELDYTHGGVGNRVIGNIVRIPGLPSYSYPVSIWLQQADAVYVADNVVDSGGAGIAVEDAVGGSIQRNRVANAGVGIAVAANGSRVEDNALTNNASGISFRTYSYGGTANTLRRNVIVKMPAQFGLDYFGENNLLNDIDTSNTINGKPVFNYDGTYTPCPLGLFGVAAGRVNVAARCTAVRLSNVVLDNGDGIFLYGTTGTVVESSSFTNEAIGVRVDMGSDIRLTGNRFTSISSVAADLAGARLALLGNTFTRNTGIPIYAQNMNDSTISGSSIIDNPTSWGGAIHMEAANARNDIASNIITGNGDYGIWINGAGAALNDFEKNVFHDNTVQNNAPRTGFDVSVCGGAAYYSANTLRANRFTSGLRPRMQFEELGDWLLDANLPNTVSFAAGCKSSND